MPTATPPITRRGRRAAPVGGARARAAAAAQAAAARHVRGTPTDPHNPRHAAHGLRRHRVLNRVGIGALAATLFLGTGGALAYNEIQGNVSRHDITDLLGDRPGGAAEAAPLDQKAGKPINLLVMGSDIREGASDVDGAGAAGAVEGMRSDTTMIAHISADRSRVEIVSIPRDTLVDIPACMMPNGTETAAHSDAMFNSAFAIGGQTGDVGAAAACTIRTVENLTGVLIDDFVVVDFAGFINVVDALGGVPMYVPEDVNDPAAGLTLQAGCQVLGGQDALGFARARKSLGDGSDISRIGRQQELVAAIAREALGKNLLTDLPALYKFLDATTSTLTTGQYIGGLTTMAGLASSLRGLDAGGISFTTMPFDWAGARVVPAAAAEDLWDTLAADLPIEATLTGTGEAPTAEPSAPAGAGAEATGGGTGTGTPGAVTTAPDDGVASAAPTPQAEPTVPTCTK
ncbi:LytR family transcriptional regulator [Georgenia yuyongxinii]|uniref:LytR family transcriptional regulator n=1 Tax=Georgenia yuyongxinii TaxID=2589797 RepID=A0A5B8C5B7_9MICO|nr:LCP family protein [Georgenia yuyongxinii]QDC25724.1 LytR family transcriptional regulator [Georgenia yuyongxinii]